MTTAAFWGWFPYIICMASIAVMMLGSIAKTVLFKLIDRREIK